MTTMINVQRQIERGKRGGDLWNDTTVAFSARRRYPTATNVRIDYRGTGLWVDAIVTLANGHRIETRLFN